MLASNFLKTSVSNIIYIFLGGLGAILVIPIFIINFGIKSINARGYTLVTLRGA